MSPVGLSRLGEGLLLGRLDSGLHQERGSKKKTVTAGTRTAPWLLRPRATSQAGLVLHAPGTRRTGVGDSGAREPQVLSAAGGQAESRSQSNGRRGWRAPLQASGGCIGGDGVRQLMFPPRG